MASGPPLGGGGAGGAGGFNAPSPTSNPSNPTPATATAAAPSLSPADVHVLLVDDERMQRMVVASLLRKCSYKVTDVESGLQAIDKLRSHPPGFFDLVLTDVMMPDVDGVELLRHVRAEASLRAVPVVMMSANEHAETVFECIRLGAEDYLLKPVGRKEVQHIWQHVWRRQRAVREGGGGLGGEAAGGGEGAAAGTGTAATEEEQGARAQAPAPTDAAAAAPSSAAVANAAVNAAQAAASEVILVEEEAGGHEDERREEEAAAAATAAAGTADAAAAAVASSPPSASPAAAGATTTTPSLPLRPSLTSPAAAAAAAASARTFPRAAPNALTLSEYLRRRGTRPAPLAAFKLFCSALALLRPLHSAGGCLLRLRPSALVLGAGGALSACAPATADGRVPPEEEAGYAAPEQLLLGSSGSAVSPAAPSENNSSSSSVVVGAPADVYALGVLFLELFCPLPDAVDRAAVLAALRHRILPSRVLASRPREAAFVTALVHPDAAARPTIDAILTSGWLPALRDAAKEEAAAMAVAATGGAEGAAAAARPAHAHPAAPAAPSRRAAAPSSIPVSSSAATAAAAATAARAAKAKSAAAGEACARPAPPPTALPDAALLIEFLGMVRDARASEAEAEEAALAALDADAAEVERRLALLDEQAAEAATEAAAGFLGGGRVRRSKSSAEPEAAAAVDPSAPAALDFDASSTPPEAGNRGGGGEGEAEGAQAVPGSSDSDENAATATAAAASLAAGEGGEGGEQQQQQQRKRARDEEEGGGGQGGDKRLQLQQQQQQQPTTATATPTATLVSRRRLADPVAAAAADAAADAAAAAAWQRVSAAAPSLEAAFLSRFGGGGGSGQRSIEGPAAASRRPALPAPCAAAGAAVDHGTSALISQQRSDRLAAFAADLGRFSRIGQLVEVARIESGSGGGAASSVPAAAASAAAASTRGAVFWSGDGTTAAAGAGAASTSPSSTLPPGAVSPDMVCSCAFDRDDDLLATAGVARRVRIYSVSALLGGDEAMAAAAALPRRSVRTGGQGLRPFLPCAPPVAEVRASSKLSCVAWNPYVKPLLLVSGYDGRVTLWDAAAEKAAASFDGTERRVWAVDWCGSDAALFASGGDDGVARLWDAGRCSAPAASVDVRANVCSVAFAGGGSSGSGGGKAGGAAASSSSCGLRPHLLALGAADRRAYVYDIRNLAEPLAVLGGQQQQGGGSGGGSGGNGASSEGVGHRRAVSYVRWAPDGQLVSASTDSRLQRWDIDIAAAASSSSRRGEEGTTMGNGASLPSPSSSPVVATYRGHVNERNFVGLSISDADGLVATGSEDDAVYVYCGGLPSPVCRHSFVDNGGGIGSGSGGGSGGAGAAAAGSSPSAAPLALLPSTAAAASSPLALPAEPTMTTNQQQPSRRSSRASGRFFVSSLAWAGRGRRLAAADSAGIVKLLELV